MDQSQDKKLKSMKEAFESVKKMSQLINTIEKTKEAH